MTTPARVEALESAIALVAARCLRTSVARIDADTPFTLLGLDSLAAIEMAVELEQALGVDVHPDMLDDCTNVRSLAARLSRPGSDPSPDAAFDRMMSDGVLPDDVRPSGPRPAGPPGLEHARSILLTGATGFLGASILRTLLEHSTARVLCVVRPNVPGGLAEDASTRLRRSLSAHGIDVDPGDLRIRAVEGDLQQARLGLSAAHFARLGAEIDAICHAGAAVNWVSSYATLRRANVAGTLELLRLACDGRTIPFHFVSSLSVCYSTSAPAEVDETFDPLPHLAGVHLGYAQTKVVAEALVREAGARGLPITISRPALISGDSRTGTFNRDDVLAALVAGCVRMGTAPDLDWQLDSQPVDVVAAEIVKLSAHHGATFHFAHPHPRHWRDCVLWMRLYGYPVRLVSHHAWLRQLDREAVADHPLRGLRSFFLDRPAGTGGLTLPELYEDVRRTSASTYRTLTAATAAGIACPPLDANLLDTYFGAYVAAGHLPRPARAITRENTTAASHTSARRTGLPFKSIIQAALGDHVSVRSIEPLGTGSDHSIVSELAAWRSGCPSGLYRFRLNLETDGHRQIRDVVLKVKPSDRQAIDVGEAVARVCGESTGEAYARWGHRLGLAAGNIRELAIYGQTDPKFTRHAPAVLGTFAGPGNGQWSVLLESVGDGFLMDSVDRPAQWTRAHQDVAIQGLSSLHAIWHGRTEELQREPWIGHVMSAGSMTEMNTLWTALADHASGAFSTWADPAVASIQRRLIETIDRWWIALESGPRTLIHHDFNPRNICLRPDGRSLRLCAYDWELATIGAPQRDLAELLCFVLPPDATPDEIDYGIARHRDALERETGVPVDRDVWRAGFRAAVFDLMVARLPMYALVHRIRRQSFLPRLVRTWRRLYEHVGGTTP